MFRLRFARTVFAAQQLVSHGHIQVDGKKVDRRSFQVRPGMEISIREKSRKMKPIIEALEIAVQRTPDYLELQKDQFLGKLFQYSLTRPDRRAAPPTDQYPRRVRIPSPPNLVPDHASF